MVNAALGIVALALAAAGQVIGGGEGHDLSILSLVLSGIGLLYGTYIIATDSTQLKASDQFDAAVVGELVSGLGATISLANILSGC